MLCPETFGHSSAMQICTERPHHWLHRNHIAIVVIPHCTVLRSHPAAHLQTHVLRRGRRWTDLATRFVCEPLSKLAYVPSINEDIHTV